MSLDTLDFTTVDDGPPDSIPAMSDIEFPCANCGREIVYKGRGRKPTPNSKCDDCKPRKGPAVKLTGNANNLAAQAAKTLVQINTMIGMLGMAVGYFKTGAALISYQETFEAQAFTALSTDLDLCKAILRTGAKSAKVSLGLAYAGMTIAVAPAAKEEYTEKKAIRDAQKEEQDN